jgi:RNA polymerase sigma-70 factor, ECF subfamily
MRETTGRMAESSRITLRRLLLVGYDDLKNRLTRRLGSAELAGEALQDTFVRLECAGEIGPVNSPQAYLFRTALNLAADRRRAENRRLTVSEVEDLLEIADETPGPAHVAEARSDIEMLERALGELPQRCREIFLAVWVYGVPRQRLAERFGVSERTIKVELRRAREHCALRLDRDVTKRFPSSPRRSSSN